MSGAQFLFTLYKNGIRLEPGTPSFVTDAELEDEMRRSFDAGEDDRNLASRLLFQCGLDQLAGAIDTYSCVDKRHEVYPHAPIALGKAPP